MKHTAPLHLLLAAAAVGFANVASATTTLTWDTVSGDSAITGGVGDWDTAATKWSSDAGLTDIVWVNANNDTAVFGGTGGLVSLAAGGITAGGLTFNAGGYTIGSNTLTLAGAAIVSVTDSGDTATISSVITGAAGLTKEGSGTLVLSSTANSFSGGVSIGGGTLSIAAATNLPSGNALTLSGGGALAVSGTMSLANSVTIASGQSGVIRAIGAGYATLTGNYSNVAGALELDIGNGGRIDITTATGVGVGSTVTVSDQATGGTHYMAMNGADANGQAFFANAKVTFNDTGAGDTQIYLGNSGTNKNYQFGALDGGTSTTQITSDNVTSTVNITGVASGDFTGLIANGGGANARIILTKNGAGTQTLSGANTYKGGTTVNGGILIANNLTALGTGAVKISGGTLGTSVAAVNIGALTLDNAASTLTINGTNTGTVTLAAGAALTMTSGKIAIDITGASTFDKIVGTGTGHFTLTGGTLELAGFSGFEGTGGTGNTYNLLAGFAGTGNSTTGLSITGYDTTNWLAALDASTGVLSFAAVPEPSTYGLIGAGALAAVAMVRRRRRHAGKVAA